MIGTADIAILTGLAIIGALFSAVLGWLDSGETFDGRKFSSSILRAIIAGALFAAGSFFSLETVVPWEYFVAFLGGAGIDIFGKRISGSISVRTQTEISPAPTEAKPT